MNAPRSKGLPPYGRGLFLVPQGPKKAGVRTLYDIETDRQIEVRKPIPSGDCLNLSEAFDEFGTGIEDGFGLISRAFSWLVDTKIGGIFAIFFVAFCLFWGAYIWMISHVHGG